MSGTCCSLWRHARPSTRTSTTWARWTRPCPAKCNGVWLNRKRKISSTGRLSQESEVHSELETSFQSLVSELEPAAEDDRSNDNEDAGHGSGPVRRTPSSPPSYSRGMEILEVKQGYKTIVLSIDDQPVPFDFYFLRDSCQCSECVDRSTRQKSFRTGDIPRRLMIRRAEVMADGRLKLNWHEDVDAFSYSHASVFDEAFLRRAASAVYATRTSGKMYNRQVLWNREIVEKEVQWLDYAEYMVDDAVLFTALKQLTKYGLVFVKGVPEDEASVEEIGTRIGPLMHTFYGRTWDVRSVSNAKNVAYTHQKLGLHMDLLYFASPPTIQLLHCLRNSSPGGSSVFVDSFRAVAHLRLSSPRYFNSLASFPVTYHYKNDSQHYHYVRPTIELDPYASPNRASPNDFLFLNHPSASTNHGHPRVSSVNWSPPFQAPFEVNTGCTDGGQALRQYLSAAANFQRLIDWPGTMFERRLEPGECVLFNNRRVLHGRRAFDPSLGERWFKGAYIDGDSFRSRLRVLSALYAVDQGGTRIQSNTGPSGVASAGAEPSGTGPSGAEPDSAEPGIAEPDGSEPGRTSSSRPDVGSEGGTSSEAVMELDKAQAEGSRSGEETASEANMQSEGAPSEGTGNGNEISSAPNMQAERDGSGEEAASASNIQAEGAPSEAIENGGATTSELDAEPESVRAENKMGEAPSKGTENGSETGSELNAGPESIHAEDNAGETQPCSEPVQETEQAQAESSVNEEAVDKSESDTELEKTHTGGSPSREDASQDNQKPK